MPLSTSLFETSQNRTHNIIIPMKVGSIIEPMLPKSEEPPTLVAKKAEGSFPHPNVKLFRKYMKSQSSPCI